MEQNEYQQKAMEFLATTPQCDNFAYMTTGIVAELGELMEVAQQAIRDNLVKIENNQFLFTSTATLDDRKRVTDALLNELGDVAWMLSGMSRVFGFSLQEVCAHNIDKLNDRLERGVLVGRGDCR